MATATSACFAKWSSRAIPNATSAGSTAASAAIPSRTSRTDGRTIASRSSPEWLTIKIGINDLHQTLGKGPRAVDPKRFRDLYHSILERAKAATKAKVVLIDPFYLSTDSESDSFRAQVLKLLPEYLGVVAEMAKAFKARHVKTQTLFEAQMKHRPPNDFAPEPVHPYRIGHVVIAEALYAALRD